MLRRIALSLSMLAALVVILPLATSTAHNLGFQFTASSHHARHSRAWWRRHRALVRRRQALLARRRELLALRRGGVTPPAIAKASDNHAYLPAPIALPEGVYRDGAMPLPEGWAPGSTNNGASNFRITRPSGMPEANATLAVAVPVSASGNQPVGREQRNMLGAVSCNDLRRTVIDRMISAGGWVVNDRQREIHGRRVFQVIAQTPATSDGKPEQVWNFYFAEIDGRIYSLTTHTAGSFTEKLAADAELFLSNFRPMEANRRAAK
jgi:hypothetical protein